MIRKLQRKFILIAMCSLLIVVVILVGSINIANFTHTTQKADKLLNMLAENNGKFPEEDLKDFGNPPENEMHFLVTPETKFETRYFAVYADNENNIYTIDTGHIAAISSEDAMQFGEEVLSENKSKGYLSNYRYLKAEGSEGKIVIFLDCNQDLNMVYSFLFISCTIGMVSLIGVLILISIFSKRAIRPIIDSMIKQKQFITDAGHEIKTPLAIISANAEVIEMVNGKSEWTDSILNQVNRLNVLVKNLLTLARLEEGKETVSFSTVNLSKLILQTSENFSSIATQKGVIFTMDIEPDIIIEEDENNLIQLASILLDNGLKYVNDSGIVTVTLKQTGKQNILEIYNTCKDMPKGNLNRLFDRFYRDDESRSRESGGYGIGLSVAKSIVDTHNGKIEALEKENGICFRVTL